MNLTLLSPRSSRIVHVSWIEIEALSGNLVIQPGHAPEYIVLKPNSAVAWALESGAIERITIVQGFADVKRDSVVIILDRELA
jgi:F0F1-type ATP synthase epsilon subunit